MALADRADDDYSRPLRAEECFINFDDYVSPQPTTLDSTSIVGESVIPIDGGQPGRRLQ